jgi:hypothetical protein
MYPLSLHDIFSGKLPCLAYPTNLIEHDDFHVPRESMFSPRRELCAVLLSERIDLAPVGDHESEQGVIPGQATRVCE